MVTQVNDKPILVTDGLEQALDSALPTLLLVWHGETLKGDLSKALDTVAREHAGRLRVLKVDASQTPAATERFNLGARPLLLGYYDGEEQVRRSRPWATDVTGVAADLLALVPVDEYAEADEEQQGKPTLLNKPVHVTDNTFVEEVLESKLPVIVDFWADWCQPCKMIAPVLEKLAAEFAGQIKVAKVDVDANPVLSQQFQIRSIPTLMFVKNGQIVGQSAGVPQQAELALRDVTKQLIALQV